MQKQILSWYIKFGDHTLPWRQTKDPYKIWISEIMLQQTQVKTVIPYYKKWIKNYPSIKILSNTSLDHILLLWQGLGYYKRATNILDTAQMLFNDFNNKFPRDYKDMIKLKGIGDYTASAILAIAFNKYATPIDGNLKRILSRLYILSKNRQTIKIFKQYAERCISKNNPGDSIQALMDIGRKICKPKKAQCHICPLQKDCKAYKANKIYLFPMKKSKKIPTFNVAVGYIKYNNKFIITKRLKNKLLGDLWELPGGKIEDRESPIQCLNREIYEELNIKVNNIREVGFVKHQYSHFKVNIKLFICTHHLGTPKAIKSQQIKWISKNEIKHFAFPTATHKLFELIV